MNTLEHLQRILAADYQIAPAKLKPSAKLEDLGVDSLGLMELLFKVEDEFHIQLPPEEAKLATLEEVVAYIDRLVAEQHAAAPTSSAAG